MHLESRRAPSLPPFLPKAVHGKVSEQAFADSGGSGQY